jgi:hypothetical protein
VKQPSPASFAQRWALVEARLAEEATIADDETKFAQLEALMESVDDFGWRAALAEEDDRVRQIWCRLRQVLCSPAEARTV